MSPWRTVLFTPGTRPDRVAKAWQSAAADVVVMDLEDAVAPADKQEARRAATELLAKQTSANCQRAVRVNPLNTELGRDDLDAVIPAIPDVIVVPKAEDAEAVAKLSARIEREGGATQLMLIVETARGVLNAQALAATDGVAAMAFGAEDLAADACMTRTATNQEVAYVRAHVALACAAARVPAIDMITADLQDDARLQRECHEAKSLGYRGKMCLHPKQVDIVRAAFRPTVEEVALAQKIVDADNGGVVVVDGHMIDAPLVAQARRIIDEL